MANNNKRQSPLIPVEPRIQVFHSTRKREIRKKDPSSFVSKDIQVEDHLHYTSTGSKHPHMDEDAFKKFVLTSGFSGPAADAAAKFLLTVYKDEKRLLDDVAVGGPSKVVDGTIVDWAAKGFDEKLLDKLRLAVLAKKVAEQRVSEKKDSANSWCVVM